MTPTHRTEDAGQAGARHEDDSRADAGQADADQADDERVAELLAALNERDRRDARRWAWVAAVGLTVVATSALHYRWLMSGSVGLLGRFGLPFMVWAGLFPAAVALVVELLRPGLKTTSRAARVVMAGATVISLAVVGSLFGDDAGPSGWLALSGAIMAGVAASARLTAVRRPGRVGPDGGRTGDSFLSVQTRAQ
jgi:hypothetical protein